MHTSTAVSGLWFAVLLGGPAAFADNRQPVPESMTFDEGSTITARIRARLAEDRFGALSEVRVDTSAAGDVVLRGRVKSQMDADTASAIAWAAGGVRSVRNEIAVLTDE